MTRDHVVIHDGSHQPFGFECLHCGARLPIGLPVSVEELLAASDRFTKRHWGCKVITADDIKRATPPPAPEGKESL